MSNYIITNYSYDKAKQLNLIIKQSKNKNKKIDVYDIDDNFLATFILLIFIIVSA